MLENFQFPALDINLQIIQVFDFLNVFQLHRCNLLPADDLTPFREAVEIPEKITVRLEKR